MCRLGYMCIQLIFLLVSVGIGFSDVNLPMPTHHVKDYAEIILEDHEQKLNHLLLELEQKTGVQFIVLTVGSTGTKSIEQYSLDLANQWALGQEGVNNGFLFTVAFGDRKFRFEVGRGLESVVTEAYLDELGLQVLTPAMRERRSSEGIYESVLAIANKLTKHYDISLSGIPAGYTDPVKVGFRAGCIVWGLPLLVFGFIFLAITGRGSILWPIWFIMGRRYDGSPRDFPFDSQQGGFWGDDGKVYGGGGFGSDGSGSSGGGSGGGFGGSGSTGGW